MTQRSLRSHACVLGIAWAALVALMLTSLGSAYLNLGAGNVVAGLAIAFVKSTIVVWLFMRLRTSPATVRIVAATALATVLVLFALGSVDYATRRADPAQFQSPRQLPSFADGRPATKPAR